MKRKVLFLALALAMFATAKAQNEILDNPDNRPCWGIRLGWDYSIPGDWHVNGTSMKMFREGSGICGGAIYHLPLVANFYFEPGAMLYYDTYRFDDLIVSDEAGNELERDPKVEKTGLRVPLNFGYRFDFFEHGSMSVFTGVQPGVAFTGKVKFKHNLGDDLGISTDMLSKNGGYRRFDLAWTIGIGLHFGKLQVDICGAIGVLDLHKNDARFHENRVSVIAGYNF